jgi:hypothetical protein
VVVATPILVVGFNRPELTAQLWGQLRRVQPGRVFFACDGPRPGVAEDVERVGAVRETVDLIDWPCQVETQFQAINLGCGRGVAAGISWFLDQVPAGIILEDDVRPSVDYFRFAAEMLDRYAEDERVWSVAAVNLDPAATRQRRPAGYRFSAMPLVWGWATWARAWKHFDADLAGWASWLNLPEFRKTHQLPYPAQAIMHKRIADVAAGRVDSWGIPWMARSFAADAVHVTPNANLARNIGIATDPTHAGYQHPLIRDTEPVTWPLAHPSTTTIDIAADRDMFTSFFEATWPGLARKALRKARRLRPRSVTAISTAR